MFILDAAAILLVLAAVFGLVNHHWLKLPFAIGLLVSGLLASMGVLLVDSLVPALEIAPAIRSIVARVDFAEAVLSGMLSLLLFAGAIHTDFSRLKERLTSILALASVGTVMSTVAVGLFSWAVFWWIGLEVSLIWCLVFGALISPTDPIAVLGIMKAAKAPPALETKVIGESLFNDGAGVVLFTLFLALATSAGEEVSGARVMGLVAQEIIGGVALGVAVGFLVERALRSLDEPNLEILITVAAVFGMSFAAARFHVSGPLAAVIAGLLIGNRGRKFAMSKQTETALDTVWSFLDEALNAILFLLIGIEVFAIDYSRADYWLAAALLIPAALFSRLVSVAVPLTVLRTRMKIERGTVRLLTWGGLKGGISIALAMKIPEFPGRNALLTVTYAVVVFSIIVQGLSVGPLIRKLHGTKLPPS